MKHWIATGSICIGGIAMARAEEPVNAKPAAAAAWLTANPAAQVLDVRTKEEFAGGYLATAKRIPCAARAAKLAELGFKEIRNLEGGMLEWKKAGQPTIKPESTPRP